MPLPAKHKLSNYAPEDTGDELWGGNSDGQLYVFGGHLGTNRINTRPRSSPSNLFGSTLKAPASWEVVASGPGRTGLSMVAYRGKLYRTGGWEAKNAAGEKSELFSSRDFACCGIRSGASGWI